MEEEDFASNTPPGVADEDRDDEVHQGAGDTDPARKARSLRNGIFRAASLQDKLLEKYGIETIISSKEREREREREPSLSVFFFFICSC